MRSKWKTTAAFLALLPLFAFLIVAGGVLIWALQSRGIGWLGVVVIAVVVFSVAGAINSARSTPVGGDPKIRKLIKRLWIAGYSISGALALAAAFVALVEPIPPTPRILLKMSDRLWGLPGCRVASRFVIRDRALAIVHERPPPRQQPYRSLAWIVTAEGDRLGTRGDEATETISRFSSFEYRTNGEAEELHWNGHIRGRGATVLYPCR